MIAYTGEAVWPKNDVAPSIESIAVSLSRIPRFCGHTRDWYSVLCHTLVVAEMMPVKLRIHGLLHDAPECCVADVPTPWKTVAARKRENMILRRIYRDLNIDMPNPQEIEAVKHADEAALGAEAEVLGHPQAKETWPNPNAKAVRLTEEFFPEAMAFLTDPILAIQTYTIAINAALTRVPQKAAV